MMSFCLWSLEACNSIVRISSHATLTSMVATGTSGILMSWVFTGDLFCSHFDWFCKVFDLAATSIQLWYLLRTNDALVSTLLTSQARIFVPLPSHCIRYSTLPPARLWSTMFSIAWFRLPRGLISRQHLAVEHCLCSDSFVSAFDRLYRTALTHYKLLLAVDNHWNGNCSDWRHYSIRLRQFEHEISLHDLPAWTCKQFKHGSVSVVGYRQCV